MRYKIIIAYLGTNYYGSQKQPNLLTIQGVLEKALRLQFQMPVELILASRTDKGVHAEGQVGVFDLPFDISLKNNLDGLNRRLPLDIRVKELSQVNNRFHPRHDVLMKEYHYYIIRDENCTIFNRTKYAMLVIKNYKLFKKALQLFVGAHNYQAFAKANEKNDYERNIKKIKVIKNKNLITIKFLGRSFLKQMIRIIIGSCVKVSNNKLSLDDIKSGLLSGTRAKFNYTAPSNGLVLKNIWYKK